jgi:hypothetical protein
MLSLFDCFKSKEKQSSNKVIKPKPKKTNREIIEAADEEYQSKSTMETWNGTSRENSVNSVNHVNTGMKVK